MEKDSEINKEETTKNGQRNNKNRNFLYITIIILVIAIIAAFSIYIRHQQTNSLLIIIAILFMFLIIVIFNEHLLECKIYNDAHTRDYDKENRLHEQINELVQNIIKIRDLLEEDKKNSKK